MTRPFEAFVDKQMAKARELGVDEYSFCIGALETEASHRFRRLLDQVGDRSRCKACGAEIWWVKHHSGKKAPYTVEGISHFADCPHAEQFRRNPR